MKVLRIVLMVLGYWCLIQAAGITIYGVWFFISEPPMPTVMETIVYIILVVLPGFVLIYLANRIRDRKVDPSATVSDTLKWRRSHTND